MELRLFASEVSRADAFVGSALMTGGADRLRISIDISGRNEMRLVVGAGPDDINYDQADWANARLTLRGAVIDRRLIHGLKTAYWIAN